MELPAPAPDGQVYVTTGQAAVLLDVAPCTITSWRYKGYLAPIEGSPPRKPIYLWADVLEAEHTAWRRAVETSGTDRHIKRRQPAAGGAR